MGEKFERIDGSEESERKVNKMVAPRMIPFELRRRAFNKTIAKIDKDLLSNIDDYFERIHV